MPNYEAVKRHRLRRKLQAQRYEGMLSAVRIYLDILSQREPNERDVLELIEKLCVIGGAEDLLRRVHTLKFSANKKTPASEAGVEVMAKEVMT